jgi:hypothetical protein
MKNVNCWEFKRCGREPGGAKAEELGVCPAATSAESTGINGGKQGGRFCWAVRKTLCEGDVQGTFAMKIVACKDCEFYQKVKEEEGKDFRLLR